MPKDSLEKRFEEFLSTNTLRTKELAIQFARQEIMQHMEMVVPEICTMGCRKKVLNKIEMIKKDL